MQVRITRVPGSVRRSLHRGVTTVVVPSFTDDFSTLAPYIPSIVTSTALYDGDLGIMTGRYANGGGDSAWGTSMVLEGNLFNSFGDDTAWWQTPLARFTGAT